MIYNENIKFPCLCPLLFGEPTIDTEGEQYKQAFRYVQKWHATDTINIPFWYNTAQPENEAFAVKCFNSLGTLLYTSATDTYSGVASEGWGFFNVYAVLTGLSGVVYFELWDTQANTKLADSNFCEIALTSDTTLITYWDSATKLGVYFGTYSNLTYYTFRIEGGFVPNGYNPKSDRAIFTDQHQQDTLSYCMPSDEFNFTFGDSFGIPWYVARLLNYIFSCDVTIIRNTQFQRMDVDMEKSDTANLTSVYSLTMKKKNNDFMQNVGGSIYITDKNGVYIKDSLGNLITL